MNNESIELCTDSKNTPTKKIILYSSRYKNVVTFYCNKCEEPLGYCRKTEEDKEYEGKDYRLFFPPCSCAVPIKCTLKIV